VGNVDKITRVIGDPLDTDLVDGKSIFVQTLRKIYKFDPGATPGNEWTTIGLPPAFDLAEQQFMDLERAEDGTLILCTHGPWAYKATAWYSEDEGVSWTKIIFPDFPQSIKATSPAGSKVYLVQDLSQSQTSNVNLERRFLVSNDYGRTFSVLPHSHGPSPKIDIEYDPMSQYIYYPESGGGYDVRRFREADINSQDIDQGHDDVRDIFFVTSDASGSAVVLTANDGGISRVTLTSAGTSTWENLNGPLGNELPCNEFYGLGIADSEPNFLVSGSLHALTYRMFNGNWDQIGLFGDGGDAVVDYDEPSTYYIKNSGNPARFSSFTGTGNGSGMGGGIGGTWFIDQPMMIDPIDHNTIYLGTRIQGHLNKWDKVQNSWTTTEFPNFTRLGAIGVSSLDNNIIAVAGGVGKSKFDGQSTVLNDKFNLSTDGGATWNDLEGTDVLDASGANIGILADYMSYARVRTIIFSPIKKESMWICLTGVVTNGSGVLLEGKYKVFHSEDLGQTWTDYSEGLPALPATTMVYQKGSNDRLFVGTDAGIFYREANWDKWECFNSGIPNCIVSDLEINHCSQEIYASTFGRGMWKSALPPVTETPVFTAEVGNTTWQYSHRFYNDIIVPSGATLTLTGKLFMGKATNIIVEKGGRFIVNGGTISNECGDQWGGITVQGDITQHQYTQQNGLFAQGYVEVKNGALIEHARIAVNLWTPGDWSTTGGILIADHSSFLNNWRSVVAAPYTNFYQSGGKAPNKTRINFCDFDADDDIRGNGFNAHVVLYRVLGIDISASDFADSRTTLNGSTELGTGIISLDAKYAVRGQCADGLCTTVIPSTFTGLNRGIWAMRVGSPYTFVVDRCEFTDNIEGVFNSGVNDATVTRSTFSVGSNAYANFGAVFQLGIEFEGATRFTIEENALNATAPPTWVTVGIRIADAGVDYNEVYKNSMTNFYAGDLSNHYNRNPQDPFAGLKYVCNDHSNSIYDIVVRGAHPNDDGIGTAQGAFIKAAGNTFSLNGNNSASDFANTVLPIVNYYFLLGGPSEEPADVSNVFVFSTGNANTCPTNFSDQQQEHLYPLKSNDKSSQLTIFNTDQTDYNSYKLIYDVLLDGGNTAELEVDIDNAWPDETWELRAELLGSSPLSVGVLKRAANRTTVLPNAVMFEILQANPDAMRGNVMTNYLRTKADPMPEYMIDLLVAGAGVETYQTILESTLNYHAGNMFNAADFLIADVLNDTIVPDSILFDAAMNRRGGYYAEISKIEQRLSEGQAAEAAALLAGLGDLVPFGDQAALELGYYTTIAEILLDLEISGRQLSKLTPTEIEQITLVSNTSQRMPAVLANNILNFTQQAQRFSIPLLPDPNAKSARKSDGENAVSLSNNRILVHPNPANQWVAFDYELSNTGTKAMLAVTDGNGKTVWQQELMKSEGQVVWNTTDISAGKYFYTLYIGGKGTESGLIVIVH
jgi:hypothetical protein